MNDLWQQVNRIIDDLPEPVDVRGLKAHGLSLLAVRRWRELGKPIPETLLQRERNAHMRMLAAPLMLERIRQAIDGPLMLVKGPEVAHYYPDPSLRSFNDLDLIVPSLGKAEEALLNSGFTSARSVTGGYVFPGMPLIVELHDQPRWLSGTPPPPPSTWFEASVPSSTGVKGINTLNPAAQAVTLAVHSWDHCPFQQLRDLIDIAALLETLKEEELSTLADSWNVGPVWRLTLAAIDEFIWGRDVLPWYARPFSRHLGEVRDRTNLELHGARLFGATIAPSAGNVLGRLGAVLRYYTSDSSSRARSSREYIRKIAYLGSNARAGHFDTVTAYSRKGKL